LWCVAWDYDIGDGGLDTVHEQQTEVLVESLHCFEVYFCRGYPNLYATSNFVIILDIVGIALFFVSEM